MKYLVLLFLFPSLAFAGDWTPADSWREVAFNGFLALDCAQTRYDISHIQERHTREGNTWIGAYPSKGKINNICLATGLGHFAVSYLLPQKLRSDFQWVTIFVEASTVYHNYSLGAKLEF